MLLTLAFCGCTSSKRGAHGTYTNPDPYPDLSPKMPEIPVNLVPPTATASNLPNFLFSDVFIPYNATRVYDRGDPPILAGPEKVYARFPNDEPCFSPDKKWRWRFYKYEAEREGMITHKVLDLENEAGESQMEIALTGRSIRIVWAGDSETCAITSWDDDQTMRIDLVSDSAVARPRVAARHSIRRLNLEWVSLAGFFRSDELEGRWSMKAHAWKSNGVLIVRAIRVNLNRGDKLCGAEFSVDLRPTAKRENAVQLLRGFVCEQK